MKAPDFAKGNQVAAAIILETPEVYGAGMVAWARRVLPILPERAEQDGLDAPSEKSDLSEGQKYSTGV
jgi:hypothetical protein